jgi:hypothetical protein
VNNFWGRTPESQVLQVHKSAFGRDEAMFSAPAVALVNFYYTF